MGKELPENNNQAKEFVESHRDFFEHRARGRVKIEPAPAGLNTFAFDLEKNTIYISPRFYEALGFSEERTSFATCHEIEHLLEKLEMLGEPDGARTFESYLQRIKNDKTFDHMDNCVADIRENGAVVSKSGMNREAMQAVEEGMYRENLFPATDLTAEPKHIQFSEALLNESRFPDRPFVVAPEVRAKLDELKNLKNKEGISLIEAMTDPSVPMSLRLKLEDRFIWPIVQELLEQDLKDIEPKGEGGEEKPSNGKEEKPDPNQVFADAYARAEKRVPNAVPVDKAEEAFKKWQESRGENSLDTADKEYAERLGVKSENLKRYREIVRSLEKIINPETGESAIEELRNLFARIIAKRLKPVPGPRYPVEEGEDLVDPAGLVSGVKSGELEPKVWETTETIQRPGKMFGEVEITLVCDRSGSMEEGTKLPEQRRAAILVMEALKEFAEQCDAKRVNLIRPLEVRSEIYSFQGTAQDSKPLKPMSKELGEKERIDVADLLSSAPGQITTDFTTLETVERGLNEDVRQKVLEGELKKIVIVFTDGNSSDAGRVKAVLKKLRKEGAITIGVGITQDGASALTTYAPDAKLAEKADDLTRVLTDLLKEHLADL